MQLAVLYKGVQKVRTQNKLWAIIYQFYDVTNLKYTNIINCILMKFPTSFQAVGMVDLAAEGKNI